MQEGSFRADVNVSVRKKKVQRNMEHVQKQKNMNSFRAIVREIEYEVGRQIEVIEAGGKNRTRNTKMG